MTNYLAATSAIILAAGKGTRLNEGRPSDIPKVMHRICSRPMLAYTLDTLAELGTRDIIVVVGYQAAMIQQYFGSRYKYAHQEEQKGTGHAVTCARPQADRGSKYVLVVQGDDSAFYRPQTLVDLVGVCAASDAVISLLTLKHPRPAELGRIIRDDLGHVVAIKEKEVLTEEEKKIDEINAAAYCFQADWLWSNIDKLQPSATGKGELILPDLIHMAVEQGRIVRPHMITDLSEWVGVNTPHQLEIANEVMAKRLAER